MAKIGYILAQVSATDAPSTPIYKAIELIIQYNNLHGIEWN